MAKTGGDIPIRCLHVPYAKMATFTNWPICWIIFMPRGGVWPVAVDSIPGPQYFPRRSATESRPEIVFIPKEKRFLSANTRHVSKEYEKQTLGSFSPGPAQYMGHNQVLPVVSSKSAPASPRQAKGIACKVSPRAVTADTVRAAKRYGTITVLLPTIGGKL